MNQNNSTTFIDLFCGIGGFRLGMEQSGFNCVFSSEINPHACSMYEANFGENPFNDITLLDPTIIPHVDILCAGFPCQAFSKAGKQEGFNDVRGTLFFDLCRIIESKQPKVLLLENVKNLLKHDKGNTFKVIKHTLESLGYLISYKVLNAKDFGVPQNRERIIIVGLHKTFQSIPFDFSKLIHSYNFSLSSVLESHIDTYLQPQDYTLISEPKLQKISGLIFKGYLNKNMRIKGVLPGTERLSRSHKQPNRIYDANGTHPTLSSQESSGRYFIYINNQVRKLSILECYRLMGFPDNFIKIGKPTHLYNRIGNSICVPMITSIAKTLKAEYF